MRPVALDEKPGGRAEAGAEAFEDVGDDRIAVFAARVVVGDDDLVGEAFGDRGHLRALAGIALAAAAEQAMQAAFGMIAQARRGDIVLVAGKGHEPYQEIAGRKLPFDDGGQVRAALEAWPC